VNHVSIEVKQGEIVGLLGPNGAGKTTTFYQVVGLIKPDEGSVFLNDRNITNLPMYKRAQLGIGYLPQEPSVFRKLSVEDNIMAILEMGDLNGTERREKLESLLNEFRLQHIRKSNGDIVSGGERRRTEIARALAVDPKFILLDEPFAGIDPIAVEDIQSIVAKLKFKNIGILITDHNVTETLSICDRAYLLIEGKIFKHGTAEELADDEHVRRLYLGRNFELKRKDYLHDEAKTVHEEFSGSRRISADTLAYSLENAAESANSLLKTPITIEHIRTLSMDELGLKDFEQLVKELKEACRNFASQSELPHLNKYIDEIPDFEIKNFYPKNILHTDLGQPGKVGDLLVYQDLLNELESTLMEAKAAFSKLSLIIRNPAFEEALNV
jgi:lipopolysaccharide export system ATP-binding protein